MSNSEPLQTNSEPRADWNSFSRANASQRWRQQSAFMGHHVTQAIVEAAQIAAEMHILDVASGTGEPAISLARLLNGTGRVISTDISPQPLEIARQRAQHRSLTNIDFQVADVHFLPFPDASFDRVTSRLGVMFFSNPSRAFREIHRVLKPGARASLLAWGSMQQPYFESTIGTVLRANPALTLPASGAAMFKFGAPGAFSSALRDAGFAHVEEQIQTVNWTWNGTPEEVWEYFQEVTVPFKPLFNSIPLEARKPTTDAVLDAIRSFQSDGAIHFGATVVIANATA